MIRQIDVVRGVSPDDPEVLYNNARDAMRDGSVVRGAHQAEVWGLTRQRAKPEIGLAYRIASHLVSCFLFLYSSTVVYCIIPVFCICICEEVELLLIHASTSQKSHPRSFSLSLPLSFSLYFYFALLATRHDGEVPFREVRGERWRKHSLRD